MTDLKRLKLVQLCKAELDKKDMNKLRGGGCCICSCQVSSNSGNGGGNTSGNKWSPGGGTGYGSYG